MRVLTFYPVKLAQSTSVEERAFWPSIRSLKLTDNIGTGTKGLILERYPPYRELTLEFLIVANVEKSHKIQILFCKVPKKH